MCAPMCLCVSADASSSSVSLCFLWPVTVKDQTIFSALAKHGNQERASWTRMQGPAPAAAPDSLQVGTGVNQPHSWQVCTDLIAHGWQGSENPGRNKTDNSEGTSSTVNKPPIFPHPGVKQYWLQRLQALSVCSPAPNPHLKRLPDASTPTSRELLPPNASPRGSVCEEKGLDLTITHFQSP